MREDLPERQSKADRLGFFVGQAATDNDANERLVQYARGLELGRAIGRDIGGADPERMAPPRFADYIHEVFDKSSGIKVNIIKDKKEFEKDFPLFAAVNRAASGETLSRVGRSKSSN